MSKQNKAMQKYYEKESKKKNMKNEEKYRS